MLGGNRGLPSALCGKIFLPGTGWKLGVGTEGRAGARLTAVLSSHRATCPSPPFPEQEGLVPESAKPRSLGIYLRASTQEQQSPALALMGCVTLDVSTTFAESPLPVRNQRTGLRGSHLLFQLDFVFACPAQILGIPGISPAWTLDCEWGRLPWQWPAVGLRTWTSPFCM